MSLNDIQDQLNKIANGNLLKELQNTLVTCNNALNEAMRVEGITKEDLEAAKKAKEEAIKANEMIKNFKNDKSGQS